MNKVSDILLRKGGKTVSVPPQTNVIDALRLMASNNIGSVLVMENDTYLGIVTERDYSRKVVLQGKNSADTKVSEIMTGNLPHISPDDSVDHCMNLMNDSQIRYLPVFENGKFINVISITDVVKETIIRQQQVISHLDNYIKSGGG